MNVWTIQSEACWSIASKKGELRCTGPWDGTAAEKLAYQWMTQQLLVRCGLSCRSPVWFWMRYPGSESGPILEEQSLLAPGIRGVCVQAEVPDDLLLVSRYLGWIQAISGDYFAESSESYHRFHDHEFPDQARRQQAVINSWDRMFDLDFGDDDYWDPPHDRQLQGCSDGLALCNVSDVKPFIAK